MKNILTKNLISDSGQVLPLYVLIVTTMVMLWAFVINTGEIVSHKIKVQTVADLGAYAGASVMAYHMANDVDYMGVLSDSISELNAYLKGEYYNLVSQITLAQCTQRSSSFGRGLNCNFYIKYGVDCDDNGSAAAYHHIPNAILSYLTEVVPLVQIQFDNILEKAQELARKKVVETIKRNIPNISEEEIFIKMKDISVDDFELAFKDVIPSYYSYSRPFRTMCAPETTPRLKPPVRIPYQINIKPSFSGHVVVGILQKNFTEGVSRGTRNADYKPSKRYVNWKKTFGKHEFPAFTAFAAAAPIRNLKKVIYDNYEPYLVGRLTAVTDYLRDIEPANVNASHVQENLTLPNEDYYEHESLIFPSPSLAVWFIPLAGDTFIREEIGGVENKYYGEDNPFKGELSQAIFSHDFNLGVGNPKPGFPAMYREAFRNRIRDAQDAYKLFLH